MRGGTCSTRVQNLLQRRTSSASSSAHSVQSITRFSRKTFSLYAVCARRLSIQSIQYSSYPSHQPTIIIRTFRCEIPAKAELPQRRKKFQTTRHLNARESEFQYPPHPSINRACRTSEKLCSTSRRRRSLSTTTALQTAVSVQVFGRSSQKRTQRQQRKLRTCPTIAHTVGSRELARSSRRVSDNRQPFPTNPTIP